MPTQVPISVEEYLGTTYRPDCDYVDGAVVERNLGAPEEEIVRTPPVLCIEILSPEDTLSRTMERVREYFEMDVPVCWMIDPADRRGWIATPGILRDAADGILRAGEIEMPLDEVLG